MFRKIKKINQKYKQDITLFLFLCLFWIGISGILHTELLLLMILSSISTIIIVRKLNLMPDIRFSKRGVSYILFMLKSMFQSSINTIQLFSGKVSHVHSDIKKISFPKKNSDIETVMHAAAITMTPGTAVIQISKKKDAMIIHGIAPSFLEDLPDKGALSIINSKKVSVLSVLLKRVKVFINDIRGNVQKYQSALKISIQSKESKNKNTTVTNKTIKTNQFLVDTKPIKSSRGSSAVKTVSKNKKSKKKTITRVPVKRKGSVNISNFKGFRGIGSF